MLATSIRDTSAVGSKELSQRVAQLASNDRKN
jgi:hypothetical protein